MVATEVHSLLLSSAFEKILGRGEFLGAVVFVKCLSSDVVRYLSSDEKFGPTGWRVYRVADFESNRTITADSAVEYREEKKDPILLLIDPALAGAGMDGIYSSAREIDEACLFKTAIRLALLEITKRLSSKDREFAEQALKKATGYRRRHSVSPWSKFDYLCRISGSGRHPGAFLHLLGLWPVADVVGQESMLDNSRKFVERLFSTGTSSLTVNARIESLRLSEKTDAEQLTDLERFLYVAQTKPLLDALSDLERIESLWIGHLLVESADEINAIALETWRNKNGSIAKWSGLREESRDSPPQLILKADPIRADDYSSLEIRWKTQPSNLKKRAVEYNVVILTDSEFEIASRDIYHSARTMEKCRFNNGDFSILSEDSVVSAKAVVSVIGNDEVEKEESEEFLIRFGDPPEKTMGGVGRSVRTFSEGLMELEDWSEVTDVVSSLSTPLNPNVEMAEDSKGQVLLRMPVRKKSFKVFRPPLVRETETIWVNHDGQIGRWRVSVRESGVRVNLPEFLPIEASTSSAELRFNEASRRMAKRISGVGGGVALVHDQESREFEVSKEYLLAWNALLETGNPLFSLCNTVEILSLSGRTIGLIVLPTHPLRVAWLAAYDNLVFHTAFNQSQNPSSIRNEFRCLDGAMFPAFLPNPAGGAFVFGDTLGFHAVGMVSDRDKEPKAAIAVLARALGESESADSTPTVGTQSAEILGKEIVKYLDCHEMPKQLRIHAVRAGDGRTIARSLGFVIRQYEEKELDDEVDANEPLKNTPVFCLELYPSKKQRSVAGRFISEAREKRRSGAGQVSSLDSWMQESLSYRGGLNIPKLRWARKESAVPATAAHIAITFDIFRTRVVVSKISNDRPLRPYHAFGLLSSFERVFSSDPDPLWSSIVPIRNSGEKHPADRTHTERLIRVDSTLQRSVARYLSSVDGYPEMKTDLSLEMVNDLYKLHNTCDWVISLERNGVLEYFDSPNENKKIYDSFITDCVPEREEMGCLQLITSTTNLEGSCTLLHNALTQMGLCANGKNEELLFENLKGLSGRLAIRLSGYKPPMSNLIALALVQSNCRLTSDNCNCWLPLSNGFIIPVDDIHDLLPPLIEDSSKIEKDQRIRHLGSVLIFVTFVPRKGLSLRFVDVVYRRHLRNSRSPATLIQIKKHTQELRNRWNEWIGNESTCSSFRAIRRARLARVLRFYVDRAHRHQLPTPTYNQFVAEIYSMVEKGRDYKFHENENGDFGLVFCPEFFGTAPLQIAPDEWTTKVFLFGPEQSPEFEFRGPNAQNGHFSETGPDGSNDPCEVESHTSGKEFEPDTSSNENEPVDICLGRDSISNSEINWRITLKGNPHLLVAGLPGMGKTTCLMNLCRQLMSANILPIIFSYHHDIETQFKDQFKLVRYIDFDGLGFNPLEINDLNAKNAYLDVAGAMRDIFSSIFPELGDLQCEEIRRAIKDSFIEEGWSSSGSVGKVPPFGRFVDILRNSIKPTAGLRALLARLDELQDYGFFEIGNPNDNLWDGDRPTVIRVHKTQNDNLQRAFSTLIFYGLYKDMFSRGIKKRITHALIFDEAHRASKLKLIPTMAKECRKYGVSLVLASQESRDFHDSVFSAIGNYLVLRSTDADAKRFARKRVKFPRRNGRFDKIKQLKRSMVFSLRGKS